MMSQSTSLNSIPGIPHPSVLPDISLGIRNSRGGQDLLAFHEFAHASHYTLVGTYWWSQLLEAEFNNTGYTINFSEISFQFNADPYGDGSNPLDSYIAVAESWAEHIGRTFAGFDTEDLFLNSGYIPEGIYEDLRDAMVDSGTTIIDNVSGYTHAIMFANLNVSSLGQMKSQFLTVLPSGNTTSAFNSLFTSYGY